MRLRQFRFSVAVPPTDDQVELLLDRADDASVEVIPNESAVWVAFDREGPTLVDAIVSAVRDLDVVGIVPIEVAEDDDVVSLAVVAQRIGRRPDAVRRWAAGETGPGGFPAAVISHPQPVGYRWSEVSPWLTLHYGVPVVDPADTLTAINLALRLRSMIPRIERMSAIRALLWP